MKIFIDSAKLNEIKEAYDSGILDGVTTNPSLIKKAAEEMKKNGEKVDMEGYIKEILKTAKNARVSLEVTEFAYDKMVEQGRAIFKMFNSVAKNVYIKIPANPSFEGERGKEFDGLRAIRTLSEEGIPINCTLVFTPEQALLAAKAGAKIVSPFAGRLDDYIRAKNNIQFGKSDYFPAEGLPASATRHNFADVGGLQAGKDGLDDNGIVSGIDLVRQIVEIFKKHCVKAEVLAASMRNARQVREAALAGADISTIPFDVIKDLMSHHKTREGMKDFTADAIPEYIDLAK